MHMLGHGRGYVSVFIIKINLKQTTQPGQGSSATIYDMDDPRTIRRG